MVLTVIGVVGAPWLPKSGNGLSRTGNTEQRRNILCEGSYRNGIVGA
jgi:hypothetical protein